MNENLLRIAHGRTMVIVSHRLSSLTNCDQILVMEEGKSTTLVRTSSYSSAARSIVNSGASKTGIWKRAKGRVI